MAARSTRVVVQNTTGLFLHWLGDGLDHGIWTNPWFPPKLIAPGATVEWRSESNGFLTGTEGHVDYAVGTDPVALHLHWDNPFAGSNSYDASAPTGFDVQRSGGAGNNATVNFRLRQTAAVWQPVQNLPTANNSPIAMSTAWLLTDGSLLVKEDAAGVCWSVVPDSQGDYARGTWSKRRAMSPDRRYFASAVLADGRLFVAGGEYVNNSGTSTDTNATEIYDPTTDTWTSLTAKLPAAGWSNIGDAPCAVLADGRVLLGNYNSSSVIFFNPSTDTFSAAASKADSGSEESWVLLPDGSVLTVENTNNANRAAERFVPSTNTWVNAGTVPVALPQVPFGTTFVPEIGPGITLTNGSVFYAGASGATATYTPNSDPTKLWRTTRSFPNDPTGRPYQAMDTPGCLLPSGRVLLVAAPNDIGAGKKFPPGLAFFEYDPFADTMVAAAGPPNVSGIPAYNTRLLQLPNGQVLLTMSNGNAYVYVSLGSANDSWRPKLDWWPIGTDGAGSFRLWGEQLNGLSQCSAYGDDAAVATNYPVARFRSAVDGTVRHGRTSGHSTMGIATGKTLVSTGLAASGLPKEPAHLTVIANGIESRDIEVLGESLAQRVLAAGSSPVLSHRPEQLDAYYVAPNGSVRCAYGDVADAAVSWHPPFSVSAANAAVVGSSVAAITRMVDHFELYWIDRAGAMIEAWWHRGLRWSTPSRITGARWAPPGAAMAAVSRRPELVDLFWVAADGAVMTMFWNAHRGWSNPFAVTPPHNASPGAPLSVVARRPEQLDVFWAAPNGAVRTVFWNPPTGWANPFDITAPGVASAGGHLSATARRLDQLDVFWVATSGAVRTTWWAPATGWARSFDVTGAAAGIAGASVAAASRWLDQLDVFWIGPTGAVQTTFWNPVRGWARSLAITPAGAAPRTGRVAAAARLFEAIDVGFTTPAGAIGHTAWTPASGWTPVDPATGPGAGHL